MFKFNEEQEREFTRLMTLLHLLKNKIDISKINPHEYLITIDEMSDTASKLAKLLDEIADKEVIRQIKFYECNKGTYASLPSVITSQSTSSVSTNPTSSVSSIRNEEESQTGEHQVDSNEPPSCRM